MIKSVTVKQITSYDEVGENLEKWLSLIQDKWGCKVISVTETKVNKSPLDKSDQGFIILYEEDEYKLGLHDAFVCAKKICTDIPKKDLKKIFNNKPWWDYSATEIIEKLNEWESKNA